MNDDESDAPARSISSGAQAVAADVWARGRFGAKHLDQAAAFIAWARRTGLPKRQHVSEWQRAFDDFNNKPVRG